MGSKVTLWDSVPLLLLTCHHMGPCPRHPGVTELPLPQLFLSGLSSVPHSLKNEARGLQSMPQEAKLVI